MGEYKDPKEICPDIRRRGFIGEVKEVNPEDRTLVAYASTKTADVYREVILPTAFVLDRYRKNPVVPWSHDYRIPPVARALWVKPDSFGLLFKPQFARTQFADDIYNLYKDGFLNGFSVGYLELEQVRSGEEGFKELVEKWELEGEIDLINTKVELWEISACVLPANEDALVQAAKEGRIKSKALLEAVKPPVLEERGATPFADLPTAPEDREWDAGEAVARVRRWASRDGSGEKSEMDWGKYRKAFFWYDPEDPENFGSYKLPFADVIDGELRAVWRGVAAAMAALLGARGGVDIPDPDRRPVYNHIVRYYEKFGKEPPEFKEVDLLELVRDVDVIKSQLIELSTAVAQVRELLKPKKAPEVSPEEIPEIVSGIIRREIRKLLGRVD